MSASFISRTLIDTSLSLYPNQQTLAKTARRTRLMHDRKRHPPTMIGSRSCLPTQQASGTPTEPPIPLALYSIPIGSARSPHPRISPSPLLRTNHVIRVPPHRNLYLLRTPSSCHLTQPTRRNPRTNSPSPPRNTSRSSPHRRLR